MTKKRGIRYLQGLIFTVAGVCGIIVQGFAVRGLESFLGVRGILIFSQFHALLTALQLCGVSHYQVKW